MYKGGLVQTTIKNWVYFGPWEAQVQCTAPWQQPVKINDRLKYMADLCHCMLSQLVLAYGVVSMLIGP